MSASHTPGPWQVQDPLGDGIGDALWIVREGVTSQVYDWRCIGIVTSDDPDDMDCSASEPMSVAERDANARLIAAAPALLEALEAIDKVVSGYKSQMKFCDIEALGYFREFVRRIEATKHAAALSLAKGESA